MSSLRRFCQLRSYRQGAWVVLTGQRAPLLSRGPITPAWTWLLKGKQGRHLPVRSCWLAESPEQPCLTDNLKGRLRPRPD